LAISASSDSYPKPKAEGTTKEKAARAKVTGSVRVNQRWLRQG